MNVLTSLASLLLLASLAAFCITMWANKSEIIKPFKKINKKTWVILIIILLAGFVLRFFVVTHMHNLYYDEIGYLDIAKHLADEGDKCLCLHNINGKCLVCNYSLKSIGFTALLAVFIKIFGLSASVAFNTTAFIGTISIALMFFLAYLLFQKESTALFSALILAFHPLHIRWSGSVSAEIVSLFFILVTFTCLLLYIKQKVLIPISLILILFFTLSIKEENVIILLFFILPFLTKKYRKKFLLTTGIISILAIPSLIGVYIATHTKGLSPTFNYTFWKQGSLFTIPLLKKYFLNSMSYFVDPTYTPILIISLTIIGIFFLFKNNKILALIFCLGIIIPPALFTAYTGSALTGSEVRHYIPSLIIISLFTGYALSYFEKFSLKKLKVSYMIALLVAASIISYIPYLTSKDSPYTPPQRDYEFAISSLPKIPENCIIITQEPYMFDLHDRSATSIHLQNLYLDNDCVYYYEGESCYRLGLYKTCNKVADSLTLEDKPYLSNGRHSFYKIIGKGVMLNFQT